MNKFQEIIDNDISIQYEYEIQEKTQIYRQKHNHVVLEERCLTCDELEDDCTCIDKTLIIRP